MKKRLLSVLLAMIMVLSLSAIAFADTPNDIPAEMYQKCVDDIPEGHYLADVIMRTEEDGVTTTVEALYLPISRASTGTLTNNIYAYYTSKNAGTIHVLTYKMYGSFTYDGSTVSVNSASTICNRTYQCGNVDGYTVSPSTPNRTISGGTLRYTINYSMYYYGSLEDSGSTYGAIICDRYGNISYV